MPVEPTVTNLVTFLSGLKYHLKNVVANSRETFSTVTTCDYDTTFCSQKIGWLTYYSNKRSFDTNYIFYAGVTKFYFK